MIPMIWVAGKEAESARDQIWALEGPSFLVATIGSQVELAEAQDGIRPDLIIILGSNLGFRVSYPKVSRKALFPKITRNVVPRIRFRHNTTISRTMIKKAMQSHA